MRQLLKVARMGHPVLRKVAEPLDPKDLASPETQDFIDSMLATMVEYDGVGLAAPQVHVSKRVVVFAEGAGLRNANGEAVLALINPRITPLTEETSAMWEGCLSVPGLRGKVSRPNHVRVQALDRHGNELDVELEEFAAVVVQHECDHLDGVLYLDRLDDPRELAYEEEFDRYWAHHAADEGVYVDS